MMKREKDWWDSMSTKEGGQPWTGEQVEAMGGYQMTREG